MKEEIENVTNELKARLHSPLFGSFLITWLCINWYIPVSLIFYSQADLKLDGYKSFSDAIVHHTNIWYNLVIPLVIAVIYTFGYPFVRALINEHIMRVNTKSDNKIVHITAAAINHQKIINELNEKYKLLEQLYKKEKEENNKLTEAYELLKIDFKEASETNIKKGTELKELQAKMDNFSYKNTNEFLNGNWEVSYFDESSKKIDEQWLIVGNEIRNTQSVMYNIKLQVSNGSQLVLQLQPGYGYTYKNLFLSITNTEDILRGKDERNKLFTMTYIG